MKYSQENEDKMRLLYKKMIKSSLSRKQFCKAEKVAYSTFGYWVKKFESKSSFKELIVSNATPVQRANQVEVEFPTGVKLRFSDLPDAAWLKSLI
jgi:hypothetical protein